MAQRKRTEKQDKTEKIIRIGGFVIAIVGAITAFITFYNNQKHPDPLKETRLSTYKNLSTLVGKMISTSNNDSLSNLADTFEQDFYNGEMILVEDTIVSLAMRRFKFELHDKLNGIENIENPNKFQNTGRDVIQACQDHILEMIKKSKN